MKEKWLKKENMIVFVLIGILLLVIAIPIDSKSGKEKKTPDSEKDESKDAELSYSNMEQVDEEMEYCLILESTCGEHAGWHHCCCRRAC